MLRYADNAAYAGVCSECKSTVKAKSEKCNKNAIKWWRLCSLKLCWVTNSGDNSFLTTMHIKLYE